MVEQSEKEFSIGKHVTFPRGLGVTTSEIYLFFGKLNQFKYYNPSSFWTSPLLTYCHANNYNILRSKIFNRALSYLSSTGPQNISEHRDVDPEDSLEVIGDCLII